MDVSEMTGLDVDGLHRRRVLPWGLGPLALLAVLAAGSHVAIEAPPHNPGGDQTLGGLWPNVGQTMESVENSGPVNQGNQQKHLPSGDVKEELHATYCSLLYQEQRRRGAHCVSRLAAWWAARAA